MKNYCQNRGGRRYFRMRVPQALHSQLGTEITQPIHTLDLQTAYRRCRLLGARLQQVFDQALSGIISMSILHPYIRELCANLLYADEIEMESGCHTAEGYEELKAHYEKAFREKDCKDGLLFLDMLRSEGLKYNPDDPGTKAVIMNFYQGMIETFRILKERAAGNFRNGYDAPDKDGQMSPLLSKKNQTMSPPLPGVPILQKKEGSEEMKTVFVPVTLKDKLTQLMMKNARNMVRFKKQTPPHAEETLHNAKQSATAQPQNTAAQLPPGVRKGISIRDGIERFLLEKKTTRNMDRKTERMRRNMLSVITEWFGADCMLHEIDRDQIMTLRRDVLAHYPAHRQKKPELQGKPLKELLSMNLPVISEKTQTHYLEEWNVFFNWAVDCGYMAANPARRMRKKQDLADLTEERPPFTDKELKLIFTDLGKTKLPNGPKSFRYWIPLIGLYQGMRLNEICQLYLDDILVVDGLPCIRIQANRQRKQKVKNSSSIRTIPIHSTLLKLGFLDYCIRRMRQKSRKNDQLFEELTQTESGYQRKMQRFNARIHENLGIAEKKTFHSFRHNFDSELSNLEPNKFLIQCLDGHARPGELGGRYSKGDLSAMSKTLEKVHYKGLNIFTCLNAEPLTDKKITEQIRQWEKFLSD